MCFHREQLWKDPRWKWRTTNCRNKNAVDFIAAVYGLTPQIVQPDGVRAKAVGQKLLPHMWNGNPDLHGTFWRVMVDANIKKVVLRRKSALQVYVSLACAAASGEWISKGSDHLQVLGCSNNIGRAKPCEESRRRTKGPCGCIMQVYIPPAAYMQFVKEYDAWYDFYASITAGQEVCKCVCKPYVPLFDAKALAYRQNSCWLQKENS